MLISKYSSYWWIRSIIPKSTDDSISKLWPKPLSINTSINPPKPIKISHSNLFRSSGNISWALMPSKPSEEQSWLIYFEILKRAIANAIYICNNQ